ncbi:MAG: hypothetical protein FJX36_14120 [Alphaproteobacteria bacterium]|nr:hypothetical protein [Alphaproteobacteria bacterium]
MDRATPARRIVCLPNRLLHLALAGEEARVNSLEPVGDYIKVGDVARALAVLLRVPKPAHDPYNVAYGESTTTGALLDIVGATVPGFH